MFEIKKKVASIQNPRKLLLYAHPKCGKTTALSLLEHCLLIDLEDGSNFIEDGYVFNALLEAANRLKCSSREVLTHPAGYETILTVLSELAAQLSAQAAEGKLPFKYIALDTTTSLLELAGWLAVMNYKNSVIGKSYTGSNLTDGKDALPNGAGYAHVREAFDQICDIFSGLGDCFILVSHAKDASINKDGKDLSAKDLAISGKLKMLVCASCDAIGFLYRKNKTETWISFKADERDLATGARPKHLNNNEFILVEQKNGKFVSYWDNVFIKDGK